MFDKRLMEMCPESRKYIVGNILLQFLELCLNAAMIVTIALSVQNLYDIKTPRFIQFNYSSADFAA